MNRKNEAGFTIVEVILAMVIALVIVFPFMTSYILSTKINTNADFMKRATDAVEIAQKDISTWDDDVLESISSTYDEDVVVTFLKSLTGAEIKNLRDTLRTSDFEALQGTWTTENINTLQNDTNTTILKNLITNANKNALVAFAYRIDTTTLTTLARTKNYSIEKEWSYLNTKNTESMYSAFRKLLDGVVANIDIPGEAWGQGLDVKFKVEKDLDYEDVTNKNTNTDLASLKKVEGGNSSDPNIYKRGFDYRNGYDLYIRVKKDGIEFENSSGKKIVKKNNLGNLVDGNSNPVDDDAGYYLSIDLASGSTSYNLRRIPSTYKVLEKWNATANDKIMFGGIEWVKIFTPTAGDVALMYYPRGLEFIKKAFDVSGTTTPRFKRDESTNSWANIAAYLNEDFYNSLTYNEYAGGENYYSNKKWLKKHTWLTGETSNLSATTAYEYIGLLNANETSKLKTDIKSANWFSGRNVYTLTPNGSNVYVYSGTLQNSNPATEQYIFPIIYLDKDLYCKVHPGNSGYYMLYEPQDTKLRDAVVSSGTSILSKSGASKELGVLVQFDDDLTEKNLKGDYFEKIRLLVNVNYNSGVTKDVNRVVIYTVNNRNVGNYSWLNLINANKTTEFKVVDSAYMEEEFDNTYSINDSVKRIFKVNGYKITAWAEYMAADEYRGTPTAKKNIHEKLTLYINKEKEIPTFRTIINSKNRDEDNNPKRNVSNLNE